MRARVPLTRLEVPRSTHPSTLLIATSADGTQRVLRGCARPTDTAAPAVVLSLNASETLAPAFNGSTPDRAHQRAIARLLAQEGARPGEIATWLGTPSARADV